MGAWKFSLVIKEYTHCMSLGDIHSFQSVVDRVEVSHRDHDHIDAIRIL